MDRMTSLERVLTTLGHQEPDRVPVFLFPTLHGAKELDMSIETYFSRAAHVAEGQLALRAKYGHDCLSGFFYGPIEVEAWGGEVIFAADGPPNSGRPFIESPRQIDRLCPPDVAQAPCLNRVLRAIEMLTQEAGDEAPIIGVVMSPFSLPVMQLGFDHYLDLMHEQPARFERLIEINEAFCVQWANAQLAAGATAICYFDPVSSSSMIPRDMYLQTGFEIARRTLPRIEGPTTMHMASGRCLTIVDDIARTGTAVVGVSALEDLGQIKARCRNKLTVLGNLNGIEMRHWTAAQAEAKVREAIAQAGPGGGYILSDNHGEIPWQVPDEVLLSISRAVHRWGRYPLNWVKAHGD
jgi:uroporphyrinogen decarboxylase